MNSGDWTDIGEGLVRTLAYLGVSVALFALGFALLDRLTPGHLGEVIMRDRNRNAARVAAAGMLGLAAVISVAVFQTHEDFLVGIVTTAVFGLVGIILQGIVFVVLDALTPGKLSEVVCDPEEHPGSLMVAASLLSIGLVVAVCIS